MKSLKEIKKEAIDSDYNSYLINLDKFYNNLVSFLEKENLIVNSDFEKKILNMYSGERSPNIEDLIHMTITSATGILSESFEIIEYDNDDMGHGGEGTIYCINTLTFPDFINNHYKNVNPYKILSEMDYIVTTIQPEFEESIKTLEIIKKFFPYELY